MPETYSDSYSVWRNRSVRARLDREGLMWTKARGEPEPASPRNERRTPARKPAKPKANPKPAVKPKAKPKPKKPKEKPTAWDRILDPVLET